MTQRILACSACKSRKKRCGGGTPKCGSCASRNAECSYADVRVYRGPRKRNYPKGDISKCSLLSSTQYSPGIFNQGTTSSSLTQSTSLEQDAGCVHSHDGVPEDNTTSLQLLNSEHLSQQRATAITKPVPIMADFLFPDVFNNDFKLLKQITSRDVLARKFTPLMPLHITKRLIKNSFAEAFGGDQPMELLQLLTLLDAQFADSFIEPGSDPARWSLVNSVTALALRFKTAPGSEADMSVISGAFYQNATRVIPDLILQTSSLLSMQALVSIAMFAKGIPDTTALSALATNVSLQLELLSQKRPSADELNDTEREAERLALCDISVIMRRLATQVSLWSPEI